MDKRDVTVYRRLTRTLRAGLVVSLVLLAVGLVAAFIAWSSAQGPGFDAMPGWQGALFSGATILAVLGIVVMLALPMAQAVVAALTFERQGERTFALIGLGLLFVQLLALAAAWL